MVRRGLACALVVAAAATPYAVHAEPRAVVELFTSQGCSSCPAADKLLGEFVSDPSLVAISLPIDYWDYLGWKDTLADPRNTARQKAYSKVRGDRQVYTPQVVVNGSVHALGSDKSDIERAIARSRQDAAPLSMPIKILVANGLVTASAPDATAARTAAEVWLCAYAKAVTVAIGRGENRGKTIIYHNVVRQWFKLGSFTGKAETWSMPIRDVSADGVDGVAVFIQAGTVEKPSTMLGASMASLH